MSATTIRPAAVAGSFYPGRPELLRRVLYGFLAEGQRRAGAQAAPKALIVPHAGYVYSGAVAASAYAQVKALAGKVSRVVLLGPCHRVAVRGMALPEVDAFDTPLGRIEIDSAAVAAIAGMPGVGGSAGAHAADHAIEVHLPFLQETLGRFRLLPLLVGNADPRDVAAVLERLWGGAETLIVVSSDLSHYLPYEEARRVDRGTVDAMLALDDRIDHRQACGATPVNALLQLARRRGLAVALLDLRNSGDTAGDKDRVVGYASLAFREAPGVAAQDGQVACQAKTADRGAHLTGIARDAIGRRFGRAVALLADAPYLAEPGATFVTLTMGGRLRGCIGSLVAHRPLLDDLRHNAVAAAFSDPRFAPLPESEFAAVQVEVSELSPPEPISFSGEAELRGLLRPHQDGVILEHGARRATFLPQVWETLPDVRDFLAQLKVKAGLPRDFWAPGVRVSRYSVVKWVEE